MATTTVPASHRGVVLDTVHKDLSGVSLKKLPVPGVDFGSALVRILSAGVLSYQRDIYTGERDYPLPKPLVGGFSAIGRVAAVGPDATSLQPGQLVYVDCVIRGRDDPGAWVLSANSDGVSAGSQKLMRDVWRDGTFAEYAKFPLENCIALNENRLCKQLGYSLQELVYISYLLVSYGGLRDIQIEPGETVVICPATGGFGGAAVRMAVTLGTRVIAMGRNAQELARIKERVFAENPKAAIETVKITGDEAADATALQAFGIIDAVLDFSPPMANRATHLNSAILALRPRGRVSLMGGFSDNPIPSFHMIANDITVKAKFMYSRADITRLIQVLEMGLFPRGGSFVDVASFAIDDWKAALDKAAAFVGIDRFVVINP